MLLLLLHLNDATAACVCPHPLCLLPDRSLLLATGCELRLQLLYSNLQSCRNTDMHGTSPPMLCTWQVQISWLLLLLQPPLGELA